MPAAAVTDHGNISNAIKLIKECKDTSVKPIVGLEVYVAYDSRHNMNSKVGEYHHMVFLAKDDKGYENLCKMVTEGYHIGFRYKPRVDSEFIAQHHEGLICLTGCIAGELPQLLLADKKEEALNYAEWLLDLFGNDLYIELQKHGSGRKEDDVDDIMRAHPLLLSLAREMSIPVVATNDAHYMKSDDADIHDTLLCVQTNKMRSDTKRMKFPAWTFYFRSPEEMKALFAECPDAIENTVAVAEKCNFTMGLYKHTYLPQYPDLPEGKTADAYLRELCYESLSHMPGRRKAGFNERLEYELDVIKQMGFSPYFLITSDFVRFAKEQDIKVGVGRGSAAGSIVCFLLGVTGVDPIENNLLFERFLNESRYTPPDADIDFEPDKRDMVIDYLRAKYPGRTMLLAEYSAMQSRRAIRDVAKAFGKDDGRIANVIPKEYKDLKDAYENVPKFKQLAETKEYKAVYQHAKRLQGVRRAAGHHPGGVVILTDDSPPMPLTGKTETPIIDYDMEDVEAIGLLKHDILAVKMLSKLALTTEYIQERTGKYIPDAPKTPDKSVFEMIADGDVSGIFQLEGSAGMRQLVMDVKPKNINELSTVIALFRPGPRDSGMVDQYLANKSSGKWEPLHPLLKDVLRDSYGVVVFQEQLLSCLRILAGYSMGEADIIRRLVSKKRPEELAAKKDEFVKRAQEHSGLTEQEASDIFQTIESFANYCFNKAHSASYATLAYQSAWYKHHYPQEFMAASIEHDTNFEQRAIYIADARKMGYKIRPPDINALDHRAHPIGKDTIMLGLSNIKGYSGAESLPAGPFTSLYDFCLKSGMGKKQVETLIRAGAFDSMDTNRNKLLNQIDGIIKSAKTVRKAQEKGQGFLFDMPEAELMDDDVLFTADEHYRWDYELFGTYLAGHPLEKWADKIKRHRTHSSIEAEAKDAGKAYVFLDEGDVVTICGRVVDVLPRLDKNNRRMALFRIEDMEGKVGAVCFASNYPQYEDLIYQNGLIQVTGRVSKYGSLPKIKVDDATNLVSLQEEQVCIIEATGLPVEDWLRMKAVLATEEGYIELYYSLRGKHVSPVLMGSSYKVGGPRWERLSSEYPEYIIYTDAMDIRRRSVN